jgi:hypothetical protein
MALRLENNGEWYMNSKNKESNPQKKKRPIIVNRFLRRSNIEINIKMSPDNWIAMKNYYRDPSSSQKLFLDMFPLIHEGYLKSFKQKTNKPNQHFINIMKVQAYLLNKFFSYWFKRPKDERPDYLTSIKYSSDHKALLINRAGKPIPLYHAAYCMDNVYKAWIEINIKKPFTENEENFKKTYVDAGKGLFHSEPIYYLNWLLNIHDDILRDANNKCENPDKNIFTLLHSLALALTWHLTPPTSITLPERLSSQMKKAILTALNPEPSNPTVAAICQDVKEIFTSVISK